MTETTKTGNCDMREALVSYLYNEASEEETRTVEKHLSECAPCANEMESFSHVREMLRQWQFEDLPAVRVTVRQKRSAIEVLKELLGVAPLWVKAFSAVAAAMLVLSAIGAEVSINKSGFNVRTNLFRARGSAPLAGAAASQDSSEIAINRAELRNIVNQMIVDSERQQENLLNAQLVKLQSELNDTHASDLVKLTARLQEQRDRLKALERDIDRREGLDLTDILFSDAGRTHKTASGDSENGTDQ